VYTVLEREPVGQEPLNGFGERFPWDGYSESVRDVRTGLVNGESAVRFSQAL